jgi:UDP-N-acetylmuramoyl-tripeptide--D-alanyl-D-alanine ligase
MSGCPGSACRRYGFGISLPEGRAGLSKLELSKMRLEVRSGIHGTTLINDVYNANPISMQASLQSLRSERSETRPLPFWARCMN